MKLRLVTETRRAGREAEQSEQVFDQPEIIAGRGGASSILFESRLVGLTHAKFVFEEGALVIIDLGGPGGVLVNRAPSSRRVLRRGDKIALGDISLEVRDVGENSTVVWRREEPPNLDLDQRVDRDVAALDLRNRLPSTVAIGLALAVVGLVILFVWPLTGWPVTGWARETWSSGPIAPVHRMIENDCNACHGASFAHVEDKKCLACHVLTPHASFFKGHRSPDGSAADGRCAECHREHNGPHALKILDPRACESCHRDLNKFMAPYDVQPVLRAVENFENHPQFAVVISAPDDSQIVRASVDDKVHLRDPGHLKLNHRVHLQPDLRTKTGRKTLECHDCHKLSSDFRTIERIEFKKHCSECHGLEFDDRLPGVEVPHGNANGVYRFLYAEYAKLALSAGLESPRRATFERLGGKIPGHDKPAGEQEPLKPSREFVERESRATEKLLFTRTACFLCHDVREESVSDSTGWEQGVSRYQIRKPDITARWMPKAIFSHGAHEEVKCESCHHGVRESKLTSDVLLPKIEDCKACHQNHPETGTAPADCLVCHNYHDSLARPPSEKRSIEDVRASHT